jgi:hypothetical protein
MTTTKPALTGTLLLVWEEVPDSIKLFILGADSKVGKLALASAGKYINSDDLDDDHPIFELSEVLSQLVKEGSYLTPEKPINGPFDTVVVCGFIL